MKKITLLLLLIANFCLAQNPTKNAGGFATITGTQTIAPSAIIEARSTNKGILIPRMTTTQKNAITSPPNSLMVFDTTLNTYQFYNGTAWVGFGSLQSLDSVLGVGDTTDKTVYFDNESGKTTTVSPIGIQVVDETDPFNIKSVTIEADHVEAQGADKNVLLYSDKVLFNDAGTNGITELVQEIPTDNTTKTLMLPFKTGMIATLDDIPSSSVTAVSIATANGFSGSSSGGANPSLTISTTATGVLKGNGTAISAATAETDYTTPTGAGALTNKTMSGVTNTFTNIPQSAVTNLTTDLAAKQDKGNYRKLVAVDAGNTTHTGTLTETIVSSILIPSNSLDALCDLFFSYDYGKSTGNAATIKIYLNTSNNLIGATFFASYNNGSPRNAGFFRKMLLRGTNLDTQANTVSLLNNYIMDILFVPSTVITLNPAVNNYILVTITLSNTSDVFTTKRTVLEKLNLVP